MKNEVNVGYYLKENIHEKSGTLTFLSEKRFRKLIANRSCAIDQIFDRMKLATVSIKDALNCEEYQTIFDGLKANSVLVNYDGANVKSPNITFLVRNAMGRRSADVPQQD